MRLLFDLCRYVIFYGRLQLPQGVDHSNEEETLGSIHRVETDYGKEENVGIVYLVGAGPGDPGLITQKGMQLIKKADCIIYDRLAAPELLAYAREDCECIYVGKADRHHTLPQEEINALLVKKAKEYACVVRLKGGDVYVFGRGGEEGMFLREHGISFVIVPGVTSAIAGAAYAGIPVTHRGVATSFRVITAHNRHDETTDIDFATMLDPTETLVFLMGLGKVAEIAEGLLTAGRNPMTAVAVISHATTPQQKTCIGNLTNIADRVTEARLTSPAIIVVGNVVALREKLNFFEKQPLWGEHYLVPKIGSEPSKLAELLRGKGAYVKELQLGRIEWIPSLYRREELASVDLLLFTSRHGVTCFMKNLFASKLDVRALSHVKLIAIGEKTAKKLGEYGLCADFVPEHYNSESLASELTTYINMNYGNDPFRNITMWHPTAKNADESLADALVSICSYGRMNVYENVEVPLSDDWMDEDTSYDGILFTCASSVERFLSSETRRDWLYGKRKMDVCAIGPKCRQKLESFGILDTVESSASTYEAMVHTLLSRHHLTSL